MDNIKNNKKKKNKKLPLVSIIVMTRECEKTIKTCLESLLAQTYQNKEIILVDNFSKDKTVEIAKKAKGKYLLNVDADMELSRDVIRDCVEKSAKNRNIEAIVITEESIGEGLWAKCKRLERSFYVGVEWMEAARFFRKDVFEEMGGYNEENTGNEDYDLPQRIEVKHNKKSISRIDDLIYHNENRLSLIKTCKKKLFYAKNWVDIG